MQQALALRKMKIHSESRGRESSNRSQQIVRPTAWYKHAIDGVMVDSDHRGFVRVATSLKSLGPLSKRIYKYQRAVTWLISILIYQLLRDEITERSKNSHSIRIQLVEVDLSAKPLLSGGHQLDKP